MDSIIYGCYFHGFIYLREDLIRDYLMKKGMEAEIIEKIVQISWESQKEEAPETLEGKLLHDAHMVEGGKTYLIVKALCTGTARGQSLEQTLDYMESRVLGKGQCLPAGGSNDLCGNAAVCRGIYSRFKRRFEGYGLAAGSNFNHSHRMDGKRII
ncbi:hypothetical protein LJK87_46790 [Paenibacillus sp. P25]|nr:hypothetical protein LJK87_46790 [Paenibacillus sp. P25]